MVRLARDLSEEFAGESKLKWLIDDGQEVTAKIVFDQAKQDDKLALMAVNKFYFYLGFACGNIGNLLNPDAIVIGGGVSAVGEILLKGIEEYFHAFSYPYVRTSTKIKLAQLGNDAGVIGAASLIKTQKTKRTLAGKAK